MEDLSAIVGKNLVRLRKAKGLTQQQLADLLHYSDKSISKWELGYAIPSVDILKEFADYYGVTIDSLLEVIPDEKVAEIAQAEKDKKDPDVANKAIILALANVAIYGIAVAILVSSILLEGSTTAWPVLIWAVPICLFASYILCHLFYKNEVLDTILASCFVWTLLFSFCVQWKWFNEPSQDIWYILFVGLPIQAIIILISIMRYNRKKQ